MLKLVGEQNGITQCEYLGLQRFVLTTQTVAEEWVFLSDDLPVVEQGTLGKLRLRVRFFCLAPITTLTCQKVTEWMSNEVKALILDFLAS